MKPCKVKEVHDDYIAFDNGFRLESDHDSDWCESHFLSFRDLSIEDFTGLEFDLDSDFFERVEYYGIRLIPIEGHRVSVPGYGYNNGYYSSQLDLVLTNDTTTKVFDITECQEITE